MDSIDRKKFVIKFRKPMIDEENEKIECCGNDAAHWWYIQETGNWSRLIGFTAQWVGEE